MKVQRFSTRPYDRAGLRGTAGLVLVSLLVSFGYVQRAFGAQHARQRAAKVTHPVDVRRDPGGDHAGPLAPAADTGALDYTIAGADRAHRTATAAGWSAAKAGSVLMIWLSSSQVSPRAVT